MTRSAQSEGLASEEAPSEINAGTFRLGRKARAGAFDSESKCSSYGKRYANRKRKEKLTKAAEMTVKILRWEQRSDQEAGGGCSRFDTGE
jgi:hypothetical protein